MLWEYTKSAAITVVALRTYLRPYFAIGYWGNIARYRLHRFRLFKGSLKDASKGGIVLPFLTQDGSLHAWKQESCIDGCIFGAKFDATEEGFACRLGDGI